MTNFDLYCSSAPGLALDQLRVGQRLRLDGVDGFFDQYFDGRQPGEMIRFLVYPYGPGAAGIAADRFGELPLVSAAVIEADPTSGTVDVMEVSPFGSWLRALPPQSEVSIAELETVTRAPLADLVAEASRTGSAIWSASSKRWSALDQVTAVYLAQVSTERLRIAVLRTNAVPGSIADIAPGAG